MQKNLLKNKINKLTPLSIMCIVKYPRFIDLEFNNFYGQSFQKSIVSHEISSSTNELTVMLSNIAHFNIWIQFSLIFRPFLNQNCDFFCQF